MVELTSRNRKTELGSASLTAVVGMSSGEAVHTQTAGTQPTLCGGINEIEDKWDRKILFL